MTFDFPSSALIMIDIQNDFCPAYTTLSGIKRPPGALAVQDGDAVIDPLNRVAARFARNNRRVIATADWHPPNHISFASAHRGMKPGDMVDLPRVKRQVLWPDHCVQGSDGACFHDRLDLNPIQGIFRKGFSPLLDSYSAFFENDRSTPTGLDSYLKGLGITTLVLGGLATDYCILYSALDAVRLGYKTILLLDAVRGVNYPEGSLEKALGMMEDAGVSLGNSEDLSYD